MKIKARQFYRTDDRGYGSEIVRVTGWADVNGERWCRVRFENDRTARLLMHPDSLHPINAPQA